MDDRLKKIYEYLRSQGNNDVPDDYNVFSKTLQDNPAVAESIYKHLSSQFEGMPQTFDAFYGEIFPKKKESTSGSTQLHQQASQLVDQEIQNPGGDVSGSGSQPNPEVALNNITSLGETIQPTQKQPNPAFQSDPNFQFALPDQVAAQDATGVADIVNKANLDPSPKLFSDAYPETFKEAGNTVTLFDTKNYQPRTIDKAQLAKYLNDTAQSKYQKNLGDLSPEELTQVQQGFAEQYIPEEALTTYLKEGGYDLDMSKFQSARSSMGQGLFGTLADATIGLSRLNWQMATQGLFPETVNKPFDIASDATQNAIKNAMKTNPKYMGDFWASTMPQAVGSGGAFLGASALTGGSSLGAAALGAGANAESQYRDAKQSGAPFDKQMDAFWLGAGVGSTEAFGIGGILGKLNKITGGAVSNSFTKFATKLAGASVEEGAQEMMQDVLNNASSKMIYDATREIVTAQTLKSGAAGALTVGLFQGVASAIESRLASNPDDKQLLAAKELIDEARATVETPVAQQEQQPASEPIQEPIAQQEPITKPVKEVQKEEAPVVKENLTTEDAAPVEEQPVTPEAESAPITKTPAETAVDTAAETPVTQPEPKKKTTRKPKDKTEATPITEPVIGKPEVATSTKKVLDKFKKESDTPSGDYGSESGSKLLNRIIEEEGINTEEGYQEVYKTFLEGDLPKKKFGKEKINITELPAGEINVKPIESKVKPANLGTTNNKAVFAGKALKPVKERNNEHPISAVNIDAVNKRVVATDGYVLISIPDQSITESRLVQPETGKEVKFTTEYPDIDTIIPEAKIKENIKLSDLHSMVSGAVRASEFIYSYPLFTARMDIAGESIFFNPEHLSRALDMLRSVGEGNAQLEYTEPSKPIVLRGRNGAFALVMPVNMNTGKAGGKYKTVYSSGEQIVDPIETTSIESPAKKNPSNPKPKPTPKAKPLAKTIEKLSTNLDAAKAELDNALKDLDGDKFFSGVQYDPKMWKVFGALGKVASNYVQLKVAEGVSAAAITAQDFADYLGKKVGKMIEMALEDAKAEAMGEARKYDTEDSFKQAVSPEVKETPKSETKKEPGEKKRKFPKRAVPDLDTELQEMVQDGTKYYIPVSNQVTAEQARAAIEKNGVEGSLKLVMDNSSALLPNVRMAMGQQLLKKFNQAKQWDKALDLLEHLSITGTEMGRGIQAFRMWANLGPEGILMAYNRAIEKTKAKAQEKAKSTKKAITEGLKEGTEEAAKGAVNSTKPKRKTSTPRTSSTKGLFKVLGMSKAEIKEKKAAALEKFLKALSFGAVGDLANPEAMAALVEYGYYSMADGLLSFKQWSDHMRQKIKGITDPILKDIWENQQFNGKALKEHANTERVKQVQRMTPKALRELDLKLEEIAVSHFTKANAAVEKLAKKIASELGLDDDVAAEWAGSITEAFNNRLEKAKETAIKRRMPRSARKNKKKDDLVQKVIKMHNTGALDNAALEEEMASYMDVPKFDPAVADKLSDMAAKIQEMPEDSVYRDRATVDMLTYLNEQKGAYKNNMDIMFALWYASVLSGPQTHLVNAASNFMQTSGEVFTSAVIQGIKNGDISFIAGGANAVLKGWMEGAVKGWDVVKSGYQPGRADMKLEHKPVLDQLSNKNPLSKAKYVSRLMVAADVVFYNGLQQFSYYEQAREAARKNRGLSRAELTQKIDEQLHQTQAEVDAARTQAETEAVDVERITGKRPSDAEIQLRTYEIVDQAKDGEMREKADDLASRGTYNYEPKGTIGFIAKNVGKLTQAVFPLRFVIPFTRIPANVLNEQLNWTPYGFIRAFGGFSSLANKVSGKDFIDPVWDGTTEQQQRLLVKAAVGSMAIAAIALLKQMSADDDDPWFDLTGRGPNDYQKKSMLYNTGWKPYHLKLGDRYISYQYSPLAVMFSSVANYFDAIKYDGLDEAGAGKRLAFALTNTGTSVFDYSMFQQLSAFFQLFERGNPETAVDKTLKFITKPASAVVPNLVRQTYDSYWDPTIYESTDAWEYLIKTVPVVNAALLKPSLNVLGEEITRKGNRFTTKRTDDPVWKLLAAKNANIRLPDKDTKIGGVKLSENNEAYREYVKVSGAGIKSRIEANITELSTFPDDKFQKRLNQIVDSQRGRAKLVVLKKIIKK